MSKRVLLLRFNPYDRDQKAYNVQEIGIGKAFCDMGYDFDYITFKKKKQEQITFYENNGCQARWIDKPRIRFMRWGLNPEVCTQKFLSQYDLVICREYYQYLTYKATMNHPNVIIYNGPYWNMFMVKPFSMIYDLLLTKKIDSHAKMIITKSELSTRFLLNKGYTKVKTIGVALDTSRFDSNVQIDESVRKLIDFMRNNECILYVGRVDRNKNYPFLLNVYKKLLKTHPNLKFVVIGKSKQDALHKLLGKSDKSFEEECYKNISEQVKNGIYRIERIENSKLQFIYPLAKAFLLTSKKEIFGMVMLEAMYLGAPVVSSRNGGSVTLIENKDTGIIIDKFDAEIWAKEITVLLDDETRRKQIAGNAKRLVEQEYNWKFIVGKILKYAGE